MRGVPSGSPLSGRPVMFAAPGFATVAASPMMVAAAPESTGGGAAARSVLDGPPERGRREAPASVATVTACCDPPALLSVTGRLSASEDLASVSRANIFGAPEFGDAGGVETCTKETGSTVERIAEDVLGEVIPIDEMF